MQGCDLLVGPRIENRRIDWTVNKVATSLLARHQIAEIAREQGRETNDVALTLVNGAILKAKEQLNPGTVIPLSACNFRVKSATIADEYHRVTIVPSEDGTCSCSQRAVHHVCWHIAACLLQEGVTERAMITCLGAWWGSTNGGYAAMYAAADTSSHLVAIPPADHHVSGPQDTMTADETGAPRSNPVLVLQQPPARLSEAPMQAIMQEP
jgi:hypothetical protein